MNVILMRLGLALFNTFIHEGVGEYTITPCVLKQTVLGEFCRVGEVEG